MATATATALKLHFNTGDQPTESNFVDLLDSQLNLTDGGTVAGATTFSGAVKVVGTGASLAHKRPVYNSVAQTAVKTLTTDDSGTLIVLGSTASQIQVFNLPTIPDATYIGTFFDFIVTVTGNSTSAGSYTINTGGHASDLTAAPTAGYDDFHLASKLLILEPTIVATGDKLLVSPTNGDGALILAANTTNAIIATGTTFRLTAVAASTTTASTDVWLLEGNLMTTQATGFVTTNLFTAP